VSSSSLLMCSSKVGAVEVSVLAPSSLTIGFSSSSSGGGGTLPFS
jgi:hypothetical protein